MEGADFPHPVIRKISESVHNDTYTKSQLIPENQNCLQISPPFFPINDTHFYLCFLDYTTDCMLQTVIRGSNFHKSAQRLD